MNPRLIPPARFARSVLRTQSDERLCELTVAGSGAAFEALVARHRRDLVRHCARIVGDGDAEEAVQEALVRAHTALRGGAEVRRAAPWLRVIAHNAALNVLRARSSRAATCPIDTVAEPSCEDRAAEQRLALGELVAAVGALPSRQRDAIVMREWEGRSYAEIAERLDASPGAVRQLLSRARSTVRARMAALLPWNFVLRWITAAPGGTAGTRLGALSDTCVSTVKLCAALIPAAALGAGGVSVADHLDAPSGHHRRVAVASTAGAARARHHPAAQTLTVAGASASRAATTAVRAIPAVRPITPVRATAPVRTILSSGTVTRPPADASVTRPAGSGTVGASGSAQVRFVDTTPRRAAGQPVGGGGVTSFAHRGGSGAGSGERQTTGGVGGPGTSTSTGSATGTGTGTGSGSGSGSSDRRTVTSCPPSSQPDSSQLQPSAELARQPPAADASSPPSS